jgi:hypothetical protein
MNADGTVNSTIYEDDPKSPSSRDDKKITIQQFNGVKYHLKYKVEALPLDKLIINGKEIQKTSRDAKSCTKSEDDLLNCLEYEEEKEFTIHNYNIDVKFSYGFNNKEVYGDAILNEIKAKEFARKFDVQCKFLLLLLLFKL